LHEKTEQADDQADDFFFFLQAALKKTYVSESEFIK